MFFLIGSTPNQDGSDNRQCDNGKDSSYRGCRTFEKIIWHNSFFFKNNNYSVYSPLFTNEKRGMLPLPFFDYDD